MQEFFERRACAILYNVFKKFVPTNRVILLPANICSIVPAVFCKLKIPMEFVDISAQNFIVDHDVVEALFKDHPDKYLGVFLVHTYGLEFDFIPIATRIRQLNEDVIIVVDRCLCVPEFNICMSEDLFDVVLYSAGYSKIAEIGFGGWAYLSNRIEYRRYFEHYDEYMHSNLLLSFKKAINDGKKYEYVDSNWLDLMDFGRSIEDFKDAVMQKFATNMRIKTRLNSIYAACLPKTVQLGDEFNLWRFNINVPNKAVILAAIFSAGGNLFASSHYANVAKLFGTKDLMPNTDNLYSHVINLFNDFRYDDERAYVTCGVINAALA